MTDAVQPNGIAKILSGLAEVGISGVKPEDIPKLLPPDTMEPAMTIMAEVRAYFQGTDLVYLGEPLSDTQLL